MGADRGQARNRTVEAETAALLRKILEAVDAGRLEASGPIGAGIVRRIEGAVIALDGVASRRAAGPTGSG